MKLKNELSVKRPPPESINHDINYFYLLFWSKNLYTSHQKMSQKTSELEIEIEKKKLIFFCISLESKKKYVLSIR